MKSIVTLAILAAMSVSAIADTTYRSADKVVSATVHSSGIDVGYGKSGTVLVEGIVTIRVGKDMNRAKWVVSGCDKTTGGYIASMNNDGSLNEQHIWLPSGDSVRDDIAEGICIEAANQIANKYGIPGKPVSKNRM
jgi:hypothetical protein